MCWERPVMSRPSKTTRPSLGRSAPGMTLKKVLLPAPFGPMIEVSRPRGNATDTSRRARKAPKVLPTPSALRMASPLTAPVPPPRAPGPGPAHEGAEEGPQAPQQGGPVLGGLPPVHVQGAQAHPPPLEGGPAGEPAE